ncbi:MAG TPA: hypothetical protein VGA99_14470, partial [bacterium]
EFGLRPPIMSDSKFNAASAGFSADVDRFEAFNPETFIAALRANYRQKMASDVVIRVRGGPVLFVYTNDAGDKTDLLIDYSIQAGYEGTAVHLMSGLTGRFFASSDDGDFGERSVHQLGVSANLILGETRPGIHLRLPLDKDLREGIDFVFGLNLAVLLN